MQGQDDFFNQLMLSTAAWTAADLGAGKSGSPWDLGSEDHHTHMFDDSALLASRLRHNQIGAGDDKPDPPVMLHLSDLHGVAGAGEDVGNAGFLPLPLFTDRTRDDIDAGFKPPNAAGGDHALYNDASGMHGAGAAQPPPPPFGQGGAMPGQSFGGGVASGGGAAPAAGVSSGGGAAPPRQQRVRARRGQATDPHSIAERLRRERIAERMKALQELVPNANKTDKASMLDEIIDYVKFLQLQVKVLSMSRLGGASAVAPLVATMSSEGNNENGNESENGCSSLRLTEQQVAKLMEEDMGSAMQYLQGKGLCLMPVSLASAISSTTSSASLLSRPSMHPMPGDGGGSPASPPPLVNGDESRATLKDAGVSDR